MLGDQMTPDPQWALTLGIRTALELHGRFDAEVDTRDAQSVVDFHWAGRQAARLLGATVTVEVNPIGEQDGHTAMISVRGVSDGGAGRARAEEGLRRLLRQVAGARELTNGVRSGR